MTNMNGIHDEIRGRINPRNMLSCYSFQKLLSSPLLSRMLKIFYAKQLELFVDGCETLSLNSFKKRSAMF
jgi:hypothetical protein